MENLNSVLEQVESGTHPQQVILKNLFKQLNLVNEQISSISSELPRLSWKREDHYAAARVLLGKDFEVKFAKLNPDGTIASMGSFDDLPETQKDEYDPVTRGVLENYYRLWQKTRELEFTKDELIARKRHIIRMIDQNNPRFKRPHGRFSKEPYKLQLHAELTEFAERLFAYGAFKDFNDLIEKLGFIGFEFLGLESS